MNGAGTPVEPLPWWVAVICFTMCAMSIYGHFSLWRKNRFADTWMRRHYFNEYLPSLIRYAPLNMLPIGAMFALWGVVSVMSYLPVNDITDYVIAILLISSMVALAISVKRLIFGFPDKVKPQWLIDEERARNTLPK